ncbi:MAG: YbhB/YbcL family Raf kinase inhibitor-like protein, partial [Acidimicrobiia bacterium]
VPEDLPRSDFFHWVLLELSSEVTEIGTAACSEGVTAQGKGSESPFGCRQGVNDYTSWFAGDPDMEGNYHGYDGPCPPWNDSLIHHYVFTVFALDAFSFDLPGVFGGADARAAMEGHVLASAALTGTYTLNPRLA